MVRQVFVGSAQSAATWQTSRILPRVQRLFVHSPAVSQLASAEMNGFRVVGEYQFISTSPGVWLGLPTRRFGRRQISALSLKLQPQAISLRSQSPSPSVSEPDPPVHAPAWQWSSTVQTS